MAVNIFDKYGIKEVANVYFEALEDDPKSNVYKGDIVLFLDTLKVSTIETTAETTDATGGWGNPKLISWDYGKEITITLEDALISLESLRFMLGGAIHRSGVNNDSVIVRYTEEIEVKEDGKIYIPTDHITGKPFARPIVASAEHPIRLINLGGGVNSATAGTRTQITSGTLTNGKDVLFYNQAMGVGTPAVEADNTVSPAVEAADKVGVAPKKGDRIRIFWEEVVNDSENDKDYAVEVTISPDTFPGTYRVVGDTFMRSQKTGKDEAFQFVIGKAKVQSEVTITLEAEGDPSTFEMTLNVLRSEGDHGNEMMKLIRYGGSAADASNEGDDIGSLGTTESGGQQGGGN